MADTQRVSIFIDAYNLFKGTSKDFGARVGDYVVFSEAVLQCSRILSTGGYRWIRTYYFDAPKIKDDDPEAYGKQQRYFSRLKNTPNITVVLGRLDKKYFRDRTGQLHTDKFIYSEKGVDVLVATHMIDLALSTNCDTVVLVSGDTDYVPAVKLVKRLGKQVIVASCLSSDANELREESDEFIGLTREVLKHCLVYK